MGSEMCIRDSFGIYISTQTNEEDDGTRGHFLYRVTSIAYFFQDKEGGGSETKKKILGSYCY